jgi:hypothetical protein
MSRYLDLLERVIWTAIQAAAAVWLLDTQFTVDGLKVAGVAAVIAAVKSLLAFKVGAPTTAATLPARPDTEMGGDAGHADGVFLVAAFAIVIAGTVLGGLLLRLL